MDQNLLNGQDDSSEVEAPLSSPPQVADKGAEEVMGTQASIAIQMVREYRVLLSSMANSYALRMTAFAITILWA